MSGKDHDSRAYAKRRSKIGEQWVSYPIAMLGVASLSNTRELRDSPNRRTRVWQKLLQPVWVLTNALPSDKVARLAIGAEPQHLDDL
jgi:hypothetical protein